MAEETAREFRVLLDYHSQRRDWHDDKRRGADGPDANPGRQSQNGFRTCDCRRRLDNVGKGVSMISVRLHGNGSAGDEKNRNCPGSSAKSGLWPRQRPESQFFQRKFAYRPPLRGGTWAPSRGTWAVTILVHFSAYRRPNARGVLDFQKNR